MEEQDIFMPKTGELSRLFEIDRTTLNYYVKSGLLQAGTEENQYHRYTFSDSMALAFIRYYRGLDFSTEEIVRLLSQDDNEEKLFDIQQKQKEIEEKIHLYQLKLLLLQNLQKSLQFIQEHGSAPCRFTTEPYYFVRKEDIADDSSWLELYKMIPSIEFTGHYDKLLRKVEVSDLFLHAGLSLKESWLQEYGLKPPENSVYYPAQEKVLVSWKISAGSRAEELSECVRVFFSSWRDHLKEDFVFYLFPSHYESGGGEFDCLGFFTIEAEKLD